MKPGFDAILWLLIAGTASLIIWLLFTSLGSGTYPFPPPIPTFDPSPPPDISTLSTKSTTPDLHTPSTSSPSPDTNPPSTMKPATSEFCTSKGCTKAASHLIRAMDPVIDPCDDFYQFSCGGYIKDHPLPIGMTSISSGSEFNTRFRDKVIEYLLAVPLNNKSSIADRKIARLFQLCLDADKDGVKTFASKIQAVGGLPFQGHQRPDLKEMIGLLGPGSFPLWGMRQVSFNRAIVTVLATPQLLLPDRLRNIKDFLKGEAKLLARDMNTTVNEEILNSQLDEHINLLTVIEKVKSGNIFAEDGKNRFLNTPERLEEILPGFPWKTIAEAFDLPSDQLFGDHNYTLGIYKLWLSGALNEKNLKEWYVAKYLDNQLQFLGAEYRELFEDLFGTRIDEANDCFTRIKEFIPRWLDAFFAENFAKLKDYTELTKLSAGMKEAWLETMRENTWIEPETKEHIAKKMAGVEINLGIIVPQYPQEKLDLLYSMFDPSDSPTYFEFLANVWVGLIEMSYEDAFDDTHSFAVNAQNSPHNGTRIVSIFAGLMEEPFYADDYPLEYKYGVMGFTVGHELTHTFDPNVLNKKLLVGDDPQQFEEKVECIVDQFGNTTYPLTSFDDVYHYDGERVQGETTSDNTGLRSAFREYRKERARLYGDYPAKLPGLAEYTNDQLFFISFARDWCKKETERSRLGSFGNPHPLFKTRVNEAVKNFEAFSDAFTCKPDSPMNPPKKCRIWRHRHRRQ